MKTKHIVCFLLINGLSLISSASRASGAVADQKNLSAPAALLAQAKITEPDARKVALAKTPGGKVRSSELEKEDGHLIWSFDIEMPGTTNVTEIQVDALTGKILGVEVETPKDQSHEDAADKKAKGQQT